MLVDINFVVCCKKVAKDICKGKEILPISIPIGFTEFSWWMGYDLCIYVYKVIFITVTHVGKSIY